LLLSPTAVAFFECVSSIERNLLLRITIEITHSKCFGFVFPRFHAYFSLQTAVFVGGGVKVFLPPGFWYHSYATEKIIGVGLV